MLPTALNPVLDPVRRLIARTYGSAFAADRLPGERYDQPAGDPGLFGPGSAIWYVHADPAGVVGGIGGLLWGTLEPLTLHATTMHSVYTTDPMARLGRTASFVVACTYGATPVAEKMIDTVRRLHRGVAGIAPDGRSYAAGDPDLLRWVYATQAESNIRAHLRYHPRPLAPAELDSYCAEYAEIARRLGADDLPSTRAAVTEYLDGMRSRLEVTEETREVLSFLLAGSGDDLVTKAGSALLARAGFDLLPRWARAQCGDLVPRLNVPPLTTLATHAVLHTIRFGVGDPPVVAIATARCLAPPSVIEHTPS